MASPSDDSFERSHSPPTKLRPPPDHRQGGIRSSTPRSRSSPSPRRSASPTTHHVIPTASSLQRERGGGNHREKGTARVLAELSDLRTQLESHARNAAARTQELTAAQQEIGALKAELQRREALSEPSKVHTELNRLTQENAMVLEYLDKSMEEIQKHKEANHKLLLLQADQQRHAQELQDLAAQREQQLQQAKDRCAELERQVVEMGRQLQGKEDRLEQVEEQRRAAEAALAAAHREYADLQAIQDELLDSLQAAQNELQKVQQPSPPPMSVEMVKLIQRNTEVLQQQQATLQEFLRQMHLPESRTPHWLPTMPNTTDLTIGSVGDDLEVTRHSTAAFRPGPGLRRSEMTSAQQVRTVETATQSDVPLTCCRETQTVGLSISNVDNPDLAAAHEEILRLQAALEAERHEHQVAAAVYERELQHLRIQQEMQMVDRVDRQCYESLQRSYELSEARGRLLNASLSLFGASEESPAHLSRTDAGLLRMT